MHFTAKDVDWGGRESKKGSRCSLNPRRYNDDTDDDGDDDDDRDRKEKGGM